VLTGAGEGCAILGVKVVVLSGPGLNRIELAGSLSPLKKQIVEE
jgi:hypothetical protein